MENVLLVTIDSLRADHVGYHGYERDTTPNIDRLARDGSRFMEAYAHAGSTMFSFPSILTSVTPLMYGGYDRVAESQTVVSEVFQDAGYQTGGFHSNLYISGQFGYDRGWDEFFDSSPDQGILAKARRWAKTNLEETPVYPLLQWGYDKLESDAGINVGSYHVPADEITDRALSWLESADDDRPTFLWVHYMDVHHPFLPPEEYQRMFREDIVSDSESIKLRRKFIEQPNAVTEEEYQQFIDLYDAEIRFNDAEVSRLVEAVENKWGDDFTLALTADHGDHFLDHGYFGGANAYDIKTHVPLFISGWGDKRTYDDIVGLADIPPALIETAGLETPKNFHGYSLRDLVFDDTYERDAVFGGWYSDEGTNYVVREHEWKLIQHQDEQDELFHLSKDPQEQTNRIDDEPAEARRLRKRIDDHIQLIEATSNEDIERPDMDEDVKERLRRLGYSE